MEKVCQITLTLERLVIYALNSTDREMWHCTLSLLLCVHVLLVHRRKEDGFFGYLACFRPQTSLHDSHLKSCVLWITPPLPQQQENMPLSWYQGIMIPSYRGILAWRCHDTAPPQVLHQTCDLYWPRHRQVAFFAVVSMVCIHPSTDGGNAPIRTSQKPRPCVCFLSGRHERSSMWWALNAITIVHVCMCV